MLTWFAPGAVVELERDFDIAEGDDAEGHDELGDGVEGAERLAVGLSVPRLLAVEEIALEAAVVVRHEDAVGQRHQQREQPDEDDDGRARGHLHARLKRVDDYEEAVDGD